MIITKIKIRNFKSIYDEFVIDFRKTSGLWKIEGVVGAGKTTIGEAIIFGLFGNISGKNIPNLVSWGESRGCIELWCETKGNELHITRTFGGIASTLEVTVNGEPLVFTNKHNAQQQLEADYYDISRTTLELLCIISFNNFKSLATLNTRETKEFLDKVFGFYILSNYANICKDLQKDESDELYRVTKDSESIVKQIEKINQLSNIEKIEGDLQNVQTAIAEANKTIDLLLNEQKAIRSQYSKPIREASAQIGEITALGKAKAKEINFIKQGICPTCGAPISQDRLGELESEKELLGKQYTLTKQHLDAITLERDNKLAEYDKKISQLVADRSDKQKLATQLEEQEKRLSINTSEIDKLEQQQEVVKERMHEIEISIEEWSQLYNLLATDIRQKILGSFIPSLNQSILNFAQQLQLPYIIEFDSQFRCSVRLFGLNQDVPIANLSTGQLKTVDMCIILGVLNVIMNNVNFNVLFFDELISNLNAELRQDICRVIKNTIHPRQTVFIISHFELDDQYFDGSIKVELETKGDNLLKKSVYSIEKSNQI